MNKPWMIQGLAANGEWMQVRTSTRCPSERFHTEDGARLALTNYRYEMLQDDRVVELRVFDTARKEAANG